MSAKPEHFLDRITELDDRTRYSFSGSHKVYVSGSRPDLRVPMREIVLADTQTEKGREPNVPVRVYDTSGVYSDPDVEIDLRAGLPAIREPWIEERGDTELLSGVSSVGGGARRSSIGAPSAPRQGRRQCHATALCPPGHHHAGNGIHCHP